MREPQSIVIAGGGAIGLAIACHLGLAGARNVTLLERNRFTSGTSWHAAGIVGPLRSSQNLTSLARYAIDLFARLEKETGQATGYQRTGGLWLAQTPDRSLELDRLAAMGDLNQLRNEQLSPQQTAAKLPLLNTDDLHSALWVDEDAQINPVDLCMAYLKAARNAGVTLREQAAVTAVNCHDESVSSVTINDVEQLSCDIFINCAGLWAAELGKLCHVNIPVQAVEHSYLVTEVIDALPDPFPIVRDLDSGIYLKADAGKLVMGAFEPNAKVWHPHKVPDDADYLLFDEDWEHVTPLLQSAIHRIPALSEAGIARYINGPESFTPDTRQLMGKAAELRNYYIAAGFNSIGIMSSAGVGKAMADWVLNDTAPMDLWEVDCQRFGPADSDPAFLQSRIPESVHNQFAMHWPYKQARTGRNRKQSVWHEQLADANAVFGAPTGWERPLWYSDDQPKDPVYSYLAQHWWPHAQREANTLQKSGALFELSPFTKVRISGIHATEYLQFLCTRNVDIPTDKIVYTLMLNDRAGIELEGTLTRESDNSYLLITGAATRYRDLTWLRDNIPSNKDITVTDVTDTMAAVGVMGPNALACLEHLFDQPLNNTTLPVYTACNCTYNGHPVRLARVSYVGEAGCELFIPVAVADELMAALLATSRQFDMGLAGHYCLDACRLEKNYPHWGHDIGTDDTPLEADLMFAVDSRAGYRGEQALQQHTERGATRQRVLLSVDADKPLLLHDEPVLYNGDIVGSTTSGGCGFRTGTFLSMAMVKTPLQQHYQIRVGRQLLPATRLHSPPYDPKRLRIRR